MKISPGRPSFLPSLAVMALLLAVLPSSQDPFYATPWPSLASRPARASMSNEVAA
ncbi:hypothetical protein ACLOJK_007629 [Asimina triloba]